MRLHLSRDVTGLIAMLRDKDPWVRDYVYSFLRNRNGNLAQALGEEQWRRFDPWGTTGYVANTVMTFTNSLAIWTNKLSYAGDRSVSESTATEIMDKMRDNERLLKGLVSQAMHRLHRGDKCAIYALIALIEWDSEEVQASALGWLLLQTTPDLYPEGGNGLRPGKVDSAVLQQKKAEWLEWWKANEKTFQPKKNPPLGIL